MKKLTINPRKAEVENVPPNGSDVGAGFDLTDHPPGIRATKLEFQGQVANQEK